MRVVLLASSLLAVFAMPALAQLPPTPLGAARAGTAVTGPTSMDQGPMLPGYPGQNAGARSDGSAGAATGPQAYSADMGQDDVMAGDTDSLGGGPALPQGSMRRPMLNGGTNRR